MLLYRRLSRRYGPSRCPVGEMASRVAIGRGHPSDAIRVTERCHPSDAIRANSLCTDCSPSRSSERRISHMRCLLVDSSALESPAQSPHHGLCCPGCASGRCRAASRLFFRLAACRCKPCWRAVLPFQSRGRTKLVRVQDQRG